MDKSGTIDRPLLLLGRQRNRADYIGSGAFRGFNDRPCRLINYLMIISADLDPYTVAGCLFRRRLSLRIGHGTRRKGSLPPSVRFPGFSELPDGRGKFPQRYLMIFVTTPAPTVLPPSRIANRILSSIATGVISLTVILTVSPG